MKRIRHTLEQIIRKLKTAEQLLAQCKTVADVCRALEGAQPTNHRWRQLYGGMQTEEAKRLSQLEKENGRLKYFGPRLNWRKRCSRSWLREISEPGTPPQGC